MSRSDAWSAEWCCEKLLSHKDIIEVTPTSRNGVRITIKDLPQSVLVATMSNPRVKLETVPDEFHANDTEFLLNIKKDAYFDGDLLSVAAGISVGVGGLSDLYVATGEKEFRTYIPKETQFILRGLEQHTAVRAVTRINDRTYRVIKHNGSVVTVLALNEYDLTSDALRTGINKYGRPDIVLASNPNCRISSAATNTGSSVGTALLAWGQLLGVLNNR
jgi:hypothetical protein